MRKFEIALKVYFDNNVKKLPERMVIAKKVYKMAKFEKIPSGDNLFYDAGLYNEILLDLATDKDVLDTGEILYILDMFNMSTIFNNSSKSMIDFDKNIKDLSVYQKKDFRKAFSIVYRDRLNAPFYTRIIMNLEKNPKFYHYKDKAEFFKELSYSSGRKLNFINGLFNKHFERLESDLLDISKTINDYKSDTRLDSAYAWMLGSNILSADERLREKVVETFHHFKDYDDDKSLYSCLDLWQKKKTLKK